MVCFKRDLLTSTKYKIYRSSQGIRERKKCPMSYRHLTYMNIISIKTQIRSKYVLAKTHTHTSEYTHTENILKSYDDILLAHSCSTQKQQTKKNEKHSQTRVAQYSIYVFLVYIYFLHFESFFKDVHTLMSKRQKYNVKSVALIKYLLHIVFTVIVLCICCLWLLHSYYIVKWLVVIGKRQKCALYILVCHFFVQKKIEFSV